MPIPPLVQLGVRAVIVGSIGWFASRMVTEDGDPDKALKAMYTDIMKTYTFLTQKQAKRLKDAGDTLQKGGGELASFATMFLKFIERASGMKLNRTNEIVRQAKEVLDAFDALRPAEKAAAKAATNIDIPNELRDDLSALMYSLGLKTLADTSFEGMNLSQFLNRKYTGLYFIGRSGKQLTMKEVDTLSVTLLHYHTMIKGKGRKKQQGPLIEWYVSKGVNVPGADLVSRLAACPEVTIIGKDAERYIAHALHQPVPGLTFDGITEEMVARFQERS